MSPTKCNCRGGSRRVSRQREQNKRKERKDDQRNAHKRIMAISSSAWTDLFGPPSRVASTGTRSSSFSDLKRQDEPSVVDPPMHDVTKEKKNEKLERMFDKSSS